MGVQQRQVDLTELYEVGASIKAYRAAHDAKVEAWKQLLAQEARRTVCEGRSDFVQAAELETAIRKVLKNAGFAADALTIQRYL